MREITLSQAVNEAIAEEMRRDPNVFVIGEDVAEAGTPFCFTIDGQTKEDGTVTVRNRDDASQERIDKTRCLEYLQARLHI